VYAFLSLEVRVKRTFCFGFAVLVLGCASDDGFDDPPCTRDEPPAFCSTSCAEDADCPDGSFCGGASLCDAECTWMGREMGCPGGQFCGVDGQCTE